MSVPDPIATLKEQLRHDLEPVRPLRSEWLCVAACVAVVGVAFGGLYAAFGLREDRVELGAFWLWGPSLLQLALALVALALAMRETLPGRATSQGAVGAAAAAGLMCHVASVFGVSERSSSLEGSWAADLRGLGFELCLGIPLVLLAMWIARRGFTARPGRLGLLVGLGAAFAADSVWRLFCSISDVEHVFVSHTLGIALVGGVGWLLAWRWELSLRRRS